MSKKVLKKVAEGLIDIKEGYEILYGLPRKKARFVLLRVHIFKRPYITLLINSLFLFPVPIGIAKFCLKFVKEQEFVEKRDLINKLIDYARGTIINVISSEAIFLVKIK